MRVNLEQELLRTKAKKGAYVTPRELLQIQEYDKHTELADDETLTRIGINKQVIQGRTKKLLLSTMDSEVERFNQERVFHISQIEALCKKYHLIKRRAEDYIGSLDEALPHKIATFEAAYGRKCVSYNTYIVAPRKSFREPTPEDPLLFYKINKEYYYLIHKWGNDLSVWRRVIALFGNRLFSTLFVSLIIPLPFLFIGVIAYAYVSAPLLVLMGVINNLVMNWCDDFIGFVKPINNTWDSD